MDHFRLDGKRAIVTGGSKGIGLGIAEILLVARDTPELACIHVLARGSLINAQPH